MRRVPLITDESELKGFRTSDLMVYMKRLTKAANSRIDRLGDLKYYHGSAFQRYFGKENYTLNITKAGRLSNRGIKTRDDILASIHVLVNFMKAKTSTKKGIIAVREAQAKGLIESSQFTPRPLQSMEEAYMVLDAMNNPRLMEMINTSRYSSGETASMFITVMDSKKDLDASMQYLKEFTESEKSIVDLYEDLKPRKRTNRKRRK